jgi:DNA-binding CsgD family transcriptional regulator
MVVPAILPNYRYAALAVWRDERLDDFTDNEKQRLALFMRHLIKVVGADALPMGEPSEEINLFGRKYGLTEKEIEILSALIQGYSLREIGNETNRSYGTMRWHMQNIREKCHVKNQRNLLREFYTLIKR